MTRLIALLMFSSLALAQAPAPRASSLEWMAGPWIHEGRGTVAETWLGPRNGVLVAANLTAFASGRTTFEFLRIAETEGGLSYFASPGGRTPVEFKLREIGERRVSFENPGHDFPQRILYWREGEDLVARIEGTINGAPRHQEWRFRKN
jgi:hypothetical protein